MTNPTSPIALFVAGGTGGHLYPGIATARILAKDAQPWRIIFAVRRGDLGKDLLQREGFEIVELSGQGLPRRPSLKFLTFPFKVLAGFQQAWGLLAREKPRVVIGMGGYLSFPVLTAARLQGIPTLIHEQNVYPGIANRLLARSATSVAVSFSESQKQFPSKKVWVSGLPVRSEFGAISASEGRQRLKITGPQFVILIFGGSLGARRLNDAAVGAWPMLSDHQEEFQVVHVTGEKDFAGIHALYKSLPVHAEVMPYCHEMAAALAAADLVFCRAGASTVAELVMARKPAVLVPFPFASENHQFYNAEILVSHGAAELIPDADFTPKRLVERIRMYLREPQRLAQMRDRLRGIAEAGQHTGAAQRLAEFITRMS